MHRLSAASAEDQAAKTRGREEQDEHHVEQLRGGAVGQRQLEIEHVVTEADENGRDERVNADGGAHPPARLAEDLHAVGDERFHDGHAARQRGKAQRQEEHRAHDAAHAAHRAARRGQNKADRAAETAENA